MTGKKQILVLLAGLVVWVVLSLFGGAALANIANLIGVIWITCLSALVNRQLYLSHDNTHFKKTAIVLWLLAAFLYPSYLGVKLNFMMTLDASTQSLSGSLAKQKFALNAVNTREYPTIEAHCRASNFIAGQMYRGHGVIADVIQCDGQKKPYRPNDADTQFRQQFVANTEHVKRAIPWMWLHLFISVIITGTVVILTMMEKRKTNEFSH